jgi:iron-sulfur cluster assembly protein
MVIEVTPRAVEEIKRGSAKRATRPKGLRVGIRGGGCTGFSYFFEWSDEESSAQDQVLELAGGEVRVFVDPKSLTFLTGSTLDYATSLMARGFKWVNPQAKGTCGCGESVQF